MASEIIVQTIKGPTSGANANKVIIPSGQTLDASNGFVAPAGHVIHCEQQKNNNTFTSSGTAWVNSGVIFNYTPKRSDSLIVCQVQVAVWRSATSGAYFGVRVVNSGGNTSTPATYGDGYSQTSHIAWDTNYQFSYISGTTSQVTHTFQIHPNGGAMWFPNNGTTHSPDSRWVATITEIAQ